MVIWRYFCFLFQENRKPFIIFSIQKITIYTIMVSVPNYCRSLLLPLFPSKLIILLLMLISLPIIEMTTSIVFIAPSLSYYKRHFSNGSYLTWISCRLISRSWGSYFLLTAGLFLVSSNSTRHFSWIEFLMISIPSLIDYNTLGDIIHPDQYTFVNDSYGVKNVTVTVVKEV